MVLAELLPSVRRWVYRRLGPDMAVDDISQEALTEIARALPNFEGHCSLPAYAYRICTRVVARHLRRRSLRRDAIAAVPDAFAPESDPRDPERTAIERQALRAVLACLSRLPARRREVFILCELEGASPQQLALAILYDHLGDKERSIRLSEPFMKRVVSDLDNDWTLTSADVDRAIAEIGTR